MTIEEPLTGDRDRLVRALRSMPYGRVTACGANHLAALQAAGHEVQDVCYAVLTYDDGAVVNLAHRLVEIARPQSIIVSAELAHALTDHPANFISLTVKPVF